MKKLPIQIKQPLRFHLMVRLLLLTLILATGASVAFAAPLPKLKVSENHRFLVTESGQPFFWLGDTAWELFHRSSRKDADRYLEDRAKKGFTVIQAVALAEMDDLNGRNYYGHRALCEKDPTRPDVKDGTDNNYWTHVDYVVAKANSLGLYIAFLPTWGDKWNKKWGVGPKIFNATNAETYGRWLGARYRDAGVVWVLGGDRPIENADQREIIRAMARGLREGDGGAHLITFHPPGGHGSAEWWQGEDWLDFNMRQNGHVAEFTGRYDQTHADYERTPIKPVLDGEPIYEDHPISFKAPELGISLASDVRRPLYWDLFGGACGHTYGHQAVWQFFDPKRFEPINAPLMPWFEAINQPGAAQMQHAKNLLLSRPFLTRIPDDSIIVTSTVSNSIPGAGRYRFVATRDSEGTYAMVYAPVGRAFKVRMEVIKSPQVKAWWFNPRDGKATLIGTFTDKGERGFTPPDAGEMLDWVLVLDDSSKHYPQPGKHSLTKR